jgi:shikimate kinase
VKDLQNVNLYLIGMMGSGKTTVGRVLAEKLGYRFLDTDALVEQVAGRSISEIFAQSGESAFRELETQVLREVCAYRRLAIATGGGIVLQRQNWSYLHHGLVIWLDAPLDLLYTRTQQSNDRPLLHEADPRQKLQTLLEQRQNLYAQADVRIAVQADEEAPQVADRVLAEIDKVIKPQRSPSHDGNAPESLDNEV